jgi:hypothetical protein
VNLIKLLLLLIVEIIIIPRYTCIFPIQCGIYSRFFKKKFVMNQEDVRKVSLLGLR